MSRLSGSFAAEREQAGLTLLLLYHQALHFLRQRSNGLVVGWPRGPLQRDDAAQTAASHTVPLEQSGIHPAAARLGSACDVESACGGRAGGGRDRGCEDIVGGSCTGGVSDDFQEEEELRRWQKDERN